MQQKMSSHKDNKHAHDTPLMRMDSATIQAAGTAAVTVAMAQLNINNTNKSGNSVDHSSRSNNPGNQWVTTYQGTKNPKLKIRKRKSGSKRKGWSTQGSSKKQHVVVVHATMTPTTSTPARPYVGSLPKCNKCNFHHNGAWQKRCCNKWKQMSHTARYFRAYPQYNQQPNNNNNNRNNSNNNTNFGASHTCYGCGGTSDFRRNFPKANNQGARGSGRVLTLGQGEAIQDPKVVLGTFPLNKAFAYILFNSGAHLTTLSLTYYSIVELT